MESKDLSFLLTEIGEKLTIHLNWNWMPRLRLQTSTTMPNPYLSMGLPRHQERWSSIRRMASRLALARVPGVARRFGVPYPFEVQPMMR